ncbi:MAG: TRAP transporter large permease subunit [Escherichia coli]
MIVGTFMDITPAILIFTPIFLPIAQHLGIDPTTSASLWFSTTIGLHTTCRHHSVCGMQHW